MPKLNTTVKSVRIDNDKLAELEAKLGGKTINAWLNEQIECYLSGEKTEKGVNPRKTAENLVLPHDKYGIDVKYLDDMETMANFMGGSVAEMIRLTDEAMNNGVLNYQNGEYVGVNPNLNTDKFRDACHDINKDPQEILDKVVGLIEKGRI